MKLKIFILAALLVGIVFPATVLFALNSHSDKRALPMGCASCHKGHGMARTPMLPEARATFCFRCHGSEADVQQAKRKNFLGPEAGKADLRREFSKPFIHPLDEAGMHRPDEILPELDPSLPRHSACGDCHNHHFASKEKKLAGISGVDVNRIRVQQVQNEYEICFKCHGKSANLPGDQTDKSEEFTLSNPSYHPVLGPGKNQNMPSLISSLTPMSTIKCIDCHNNNDALGPRGPHGSVYRHLISRNYSESDGPEGAFQYALCYGCHRRTSILGNESFPLHRLHIVEKGASCKTCHDSHGSSINTHLIEFDTFIVRPNKSGRLQFIDVGPRAGQCFLSCHGRDHNPETYPGAFPMPTRKTDPRKRLRW
jgi:predicted CXXCH cytochrome family protein